MKKIFLFILMMFTFIGVYAKTYTYSSAVSKSNSYINKFDHYNEYIISNSNGFLTENEFENAKSENGNLNYLVTGLEFWIDNYPDNTCTYCKYVLNGVKTKTSGTDKSGARVTELVRNTAKVTGKGTQTNPWVFVNQYRVLVGVNNQDMGSALSNENNYVIVEENSGAQFNITSNAGYKYKSDNCKKSTYSNNILRIENVTENVSCIVNFEERRYNVTIDNAGGTGTDKIYLIYKDSWYSASGFTDKISEITKPTKTGYTFKDYYIVSPNKVVTNEKGEFTTTDVAANTDDLTMKAEYDPNKYTVTLDGNGATTAGTTKIYEKYNVGYFLDSDTTNSMMTLLTNEITIPTKKGYTFEGYYTGTNGSGSQYIDENGKITSTANKNTTNFTNNNGSLYAYWVPACKFGLAYTGSFSVNGTSHSNETICINDENWEVRFLTSGILDVQSLTSNVNIYIVGGGGGGGGSHDASAGTAGAGGTVQTISNQPLSNQKYSIVIGEGGTGGSSETELIGTAGSSSCILNGESSSNCSSNPLYSADGGNAGETQVKTKPIYHICAACARRQDYGVNGTKLLDGKTYGSSGANSYNCDDSSSGESPDCRYGIGGEDSGGDGGVMNYWLTSDGPRTKGEPNPTNGVTNMGGGGGGAAWSLNHYNTNTTYISGGNGGSGVVILSNYKKLVTITYLNVDSSTSTTSTIGKQICISGEPCKISTTFYSKKDSYNLGWSTTNGATTPNYTLGQTITLTSNLTLYTIVSKTGSTVITFHSNIQNSDTTTTQTIYVTSDTNNPNKRNDVQINKSFTRTGYIQTGWSETPNGSKQYEVDEWIYPREFQEIYAQGGKTLYATWKPIEYTIKFDKNNNSATGSTASVTCKYDQECKLTSNGFTRTGYTFDGWAKSDSGGKVYSNEDTVTNLTATNNKTVYLYAKWIKN